MGIKPKMKVPWKGGQCIICLCDGPLCKEHIIPKALGGLLTCYFLCKSCNSRFGYIVESSARSDPSILIAVQNLAGVIPVLAKRIIQRLPHIGLGEFGSVPGYISNGTFYIDSRKLEDGSLIQPTNKARESIERICRKSQIEENQIKQVLRKFDQTKMGMRVKISQRIEILKWPIQNIEPDLSKGRLMDSLIPAKIAYEFLACHLGTAIYDENNALCEVRHALLSPEQETEAILVERLSSDEYKPFHGICFEGNDPYAKVQIRLFGWLAFRIHFTRFSIEGPRYAYTHSLDTNKERFDIID